MNVFFVACDLFVKCCTNIVVGMAITSKPNGSFWAELLLCCDCCTASRKASYFPPGAWDHRSCGGSRTQSKQQVRTLRLTRIELLHHSKTQHARVWCKPGVIEALQARPSVADVRVQAPLRSQLVWGPDWGPTGGADRNTGQQKNPNPELSSAAAET